MTYQIVFHKTADKELAKLPIKIQLQIINEIEQLANNPRPSGYKKLTDYRSDRTTTKSCYRIRSGDYRIIYTIQDNIIIITVLKIEHRSKVYKRS